MADALKKAGIAYEFIRIKNAGHGLRPEKPTDPAADPDPKAQQDIIVKFFEQQLNK
jgi:dipeptidyl aminopeptidase/acylaminoacyl peptidase